MGSTLGVKFRTLNQFKLDETVQILLLFIPPPSLTQPGDIFAHRGVNNVTFCVKYEACNPL